MEKPTFNLSKYKQPQKSCSYHWQQEALDCIGYLDKPNKSQIFKWFKLQECRVKAVLSYMQNRKIKSFKYMAKLMSLSG